MRGIYKRGKIYWIAYKTAGRIVRESTGTNDRKLAEGVLAKRRAEVFEGRWVGRLRDIKIPLRQAVQEFITVYSQPRKVAWEDDQLILDRFASFVGETAYVQDIDRHLIEQFQLELLSKRISKPSVNRYLATIKCFFNRLIDWHSLQINPCRGIKMYPETSRTHWLEAGQIAELLDKCSVRLRPIVQVALLTGLRRGDILRLTWDRIDIEQSIIRIVQGKTKTSLLLPMSEALLEVLRGIPRDPDCPYVFHDAGEPLRENGWARTDFIKARRGAGLPNTRFHDLRHTAATQLRRLGKDLQVVQQLLGHKTIRTTLRYSHVHPVELREAVNKLGQKIMPRGFRHFTITSQSADESLAHDHRPVKNDANLVAFQPSGDAGTEEIRQTVNIEMPPTEKTKETYLPSSN
jgi:integrase